MTRKTQLLFNNYIYERPKQDGEPQSTELTIDPIIETSGESTQYARLDHTHYLNTASLNIPILPSTYDFTDGTHSLTIQNAEPIFSYTYAFNNDQLDSFLNVFSFQHNLVIYSISTHNYYYFDIPSLNFVLIPNFGPVYNDEQYIPFYIDEVNKNKIIINKNTGLRVFVEHEIEIGTISQDYPIQLILMKDCAFVINLNSTRITSGSNYNWWYISGSINSIGINQGGAITINKTFWNIDLQHNTIAFNHYGHVSLIRAIDKTAIHLYQTSTEFNGTTTYSQASAFAIRDFIILYNYTQFQYNGSAFNISNVPSVLQFDISYNQATEELEGRIECWELSQNLDLQGIKPNTSYVVAYQPGATEKIMEWTGYDITRQTAYRWCFNTSSGDVLKRYLSLGDTGPISTNLTQGTPQKIILSDGLYINNQKIQKTQWRGFNQYDFWTVYYLFAYELMIFKANLNGDTWNIHLMPTDDEETYNNYFVLGVYINGILDLSKFYEIPQQDSGNFNIFKLTSNGTTYTLDLTNATYRALYSYDYM